jgi:hypothetical protein
MNFTFTWLLNKFGFQPEVSITEPIAKPKAATKRKPAAKKVVAKKVVRKSVRKKA